MPKLTRKSALLCGLMLLPASLSLSLTAHAEDGDPELGLELYDEFCAGCHGDGAAGLNAFSDDLGTFVERLEGITENMPDFAGVFEEDEVAALFAYLDQATASE